MTINLDGPGPHFVEFTAHGKRLQLQISIEAHDTVRLWLNDGEGSLHRCVVNPVARSAGPDWPQLRELIEDLGFETDFDRLRRIRRQPT